MDIDTEIDLEDEEELKSFDEIHAEIKLSMARTPPASIIKRSIKQLHDVYHGGFQKKPVYVPWIPLSLIEWAFVYGPRQNILLPTEITDQGYNNLYNLLHSGGAGYESKFLKQDGPFGLIKFMRCLAHQQFWFQGGKSKLKRFIGRNLILMNEFESDFKSLTGMSINDFHEILFIVFSHFTRPENGHSIQKILFKNLQDRYSENQIDLFFSLVSLNFDEMQSFIREHYAYYQENFDVETLPSQMTPLWRFPFIKQNELYVCVYPALIEYAMKYFVYDYLKLNKKKMFCNKFGHAMESHVKKGLEYLKINFINEDQIQEIAKKHRTKKSGQIKSVDFIVPQKEGILFIESKALETPMEVKINPENEVLYKHFPPNERHVFHGIVQAFELCNFMLQVPDSDFNQHNKDFYLLIVTYKEFYLGRGKDFWKEFVQEVVKPSLDKKNISEALIKPEHIFVISLDEYDALISQSAESNVEILDILKFAIKQDKSPKTQKMVFSAHIHSFNPQHQFHLPYVDDGFQKITNNIKNELRIKETA